MAKAGYRVKEEFGMDNYDEWYGDHAFGVMEDYLNADEHLPRIAWLCKTIEKGSTVLDLGCLDGFALMTLANKNDVTGVGVDLSRFGTTIAKMNAKKHGFDLKFHNRPIEGLDLDRKFDYVICAEVIEHVKDVDKLYEVIDNHLKDTGTVFMDTPDYDEPMGRANTDPLHIRYYTHKLEHEAKDAISLPKEIGVDRVKKVEVIDQLIHIEYGAKK